MNAYRYIFNNKPIMRGYTVATSLVPLQPPDVAKPLGDIWSETATSATRLCAKGKLLVSAPASNLACNISQL